jgi:IS4 transposase
MRLHDNTIGHIAKLVQVAILTGTDVIDHLRMVTLSEEDGMLFVEQEYLDVFENQIQKMLHNADSQNKNEAED